MRAGALLKLAASVVLGVLVSACQIGGSPITEREGYFTWVDEQGRVRYSPIVDAPARESVKKLESGDKKDQPVGAPATSGKPPGLETETEYTLENYPDAEQLARDGYVRPGEPQPYFTWRDAEGNVRVSYYRPDTRTELEKGLVSPPVELTPASIYQAGPDLEARKPAHGYDPDAFAILGIEDSDKGFFERFSQRCCVELNASEHTEWQQGREFGVDITEASPVHDFITGRSPFQLISLASVLSRPDFIMRLRSYARDGVFVPSVIFLDEDFQPVRLVTDLVTRYQPENWHRRGYLEAWIPVMPGQGERWMVIFTRDEDLQGQEVIETRYGPKAIPHVAVGELGLERVEED